MKYQSDHEKLEELAYRSWIDRGQPLGSPEIDWYYALSIVSDPETIRVASSDDSPKSEWSRTSEDGDSNVDVQAVSAQEKAGDNVKSNASRKSARKSNSNSHFSNEE